MPALLSVAWLMLGSLGIGLGSGALASFFFKHFGRRSACFGAKRDEYVFVPSTRTFVKKEKAEKDPAAAAAAHGHGAEGGDGHGHEEDTEHAMIEAAMFFFASMASFYVAEIFHLSGIISALFAGMVCNHYAWYNLTPLAQELSKHFYEQMMLVRFIIRFNSMLIRF